MQEHVWRLIHSGYQSGAQNMALDESLLEAVACGDSPPVLRFYRWRPATVTIGYAQSVVSDLDLDVCREAGLDVVRRSTGGRAVLHDHEVTYAVIAPLNSRHFGNSVLDCYRVIAEILGETLRQLGLPAQLVPGRPKGGHRNPVKALCFSAPSQYELVIGGCKVAGSAQKRHGQAFLQHGSLPLEMNVDLLRKALRMAPLESTAQSENIGWLNRWCDVPLSIDAVEQRLTAVFAERMQIEWQHSVPTEAEERRAGILYRERFGNPSWTMKR